MSDFYAVILAGGSGTRFWPLSRKHLPKQLLPLVGPDTMIKSTVERLFPRFAPERILLVVGREHRDLTQRELSMLPPENIVDEPAGRDTAAAVGLAATLLEWKDPQSTFAILPADHHVEPVQRFQDALRAGHDAAQSGALVTFGIRPRFPATGYGYLERGEPWGSAFRVRRFCEKPDAARAREFLADGRHYWNSGMFVWRTDAILAAFRKHLPEHHRRLGDIREALGSSRLPAALAKAYAELPRISIDYGIMEKADNVAMIEADFEWDDVGSWNAAAARRAKDGQGNALEALAAAVDTRNCFVVSTDDGHLVATLGVENLVVVHTKDATLICPKDRAEDLKRLVEAIRAKGLESHL